MHKHIQERCLLLVREIKKGFKKYKVNDHGIIICKYLESDEIDNLWPFLRLEME